MNLLTGILATWRLTTLFYKEDGPFDVFGKIRDAVGIRYDDHSNRIATTEIAKAFTCVWCLSVWAGLFVARGSLVKALAYSAGAILIREFTGRPE